MEISFLFINSCSKSYSKHNKLVLKWQ